MVSEPQSPCTRVCVLDPESRLCTGCYRTIDEIAGWSRFSAEEKLAVLDQLSGRRRSRRFPPVEPTRA